MMLWLPLFVGLLSVLACGLYLLLARRWQLLDMPNHRSLHSEPTPHGGGLGILLAFSAGMVLAWQQWGWGGAYLELWLVALLLCAVGTVDDLVELSRRLRFSCYLIAAAVIAWDFQVAGALSQSPWSTVLLALAVVALLWLTNLYNFMDGTDGFAASQAFLALSSAATMAWVGAGEGQYALFCLLYGFACLGFLVWNWQPARLFMGDSGSIPTGFLIGGLALWGHVTGILPLGVWLILLAVFITDATWTLGWRILTGQPFLSAHRLHAYQRLSRHWESHQTLVFVLAGIHGLWLLPLSLAAFSFPQWQVFLVIIAYLPLLAGMVKLRGID